MSTHPHQQHTTEPERIEAGKVIGVALATVLAFAAGSVWALRIRANTQAAMTPAGHARLPADITAEEHGIVDVVPFELNRWVARDRKVAQEKLSTYRWIDRGAGTIQVPIERAMELVIEDARK